MPHSLTEIGDFAFPYAFRLTDVDYPGTENDWGKISIGADNDALAYAVIHYTPYIASLKANKSTAAPGDTITWTVNASGGASVQYCFYLFKNGKILVRGEYGTAKTYSYQAAAPGTYTVRVYAKDGSAAALQLEGGQVTVIG